MTASPEAADILVVNTCSFIDTAKQESVDTILEMAQHKTTGKAQRLIVAGCLVERYRDEIRKNIPEVDAVVGTGELEKILEAAGLDAPVAPAIAACVSLQYSFGAPRHELKAICVNRRDASRARSGMARMPRCRSIFTTTPRRVCWRRAGHRLTSRSRKAAITRAASA